MVHTVHRRPSSIEWYPTQHKQTNQSIVAAIQSCILIRKNYPLNSRTSIHLNPSGTITRGPTPKINIPSDRSWWAASIERTKGPCFTKEFWDNRKKPHFLPQISNQCLTKSGGLYRLLHRLSRYILNVESQALSNGTHFDPIRQTHQKIQPSKVSLFWPSKNTMFFLPNGLVAAWYMLSSMLNIHMIALRKLYKTHISNKKSNDHSKSYWPKTNFWLKTMTKSGSRHKVVHRLLTKMRH